jgi:uncharacterized SAM-binding protein YcdF (DUF218 family)
VVVVIRRLLIGAVAAGAAAWSVGMGFVVLRQDWPEPSPSDAILVLGTSSLVDGQPNPCMQARVAEGVRLFEEGAAPVMVVSGGFDPRDGLVEAETMAALAIDMGVPADRVLLEVRATSTIENLTLTEELLLSEGFGTAMIVVTEPFHLPRAMLAADRLGIDAHPSPSATCPERGPLWLIREPAAVLWYLWKLR